MLTRDRAIIDDLHKFRCMTRVQIEHLHFDKVKNKANECNRVLLRLKREGYIEVSKERRMYTYFPDKHIKKDSSKLNHFLAIADFYCEILRIDKPRIFEVEPKLGDKGFPEPDIMMIWKGTAFFVEIQRSDYSKKQWQAKFNRYEQYYQSNAWHNFDWQPRDKKVIPILWIVGKSATLPTTPFKVLQDTVEGMVNRMRK